MNRLPRAAKQAFVLTTLVTVIASALSVGAFVLGLHVVQEEVARATQSVTGTVVENDVGDNGDIRVSWRDSEEREHRQRFSVYDEYDVGEPFVLRYDPHRPDDRAFPDDPYETDYEDGYYAGAFGFPAFGFAFLVCLALRWWWWRRALGRPGTSGVPAVVLEGHFNAATTTWLRLSYEGSSRWQMVMWDPALEAVEGPLDVTVHGDLDGRRRVVIELSDGTCLVSQGRLRHKQSGSYAYAPRATSGSDLASVLVVPHGATLPRAHPWWRTAAWWGLIGAALGGALGWVVVTQRLWVGVAMALAAAAAAVNIWTLNGAEQ